MSSSETSSAPGSQVLLFPPHALAMLVPAFASAFAAWFETRSEANALRALRDLRRGVSEAVASFEVITTTQAFAVGAPKKWRIQNLSF